MQQTEENVFFDPSTSSRVGTSPLEHIANDIVIQSLMDQNTELRLAFFFFFPSKYLFWLSLVLWSFTS